MTLKIKQTFRRLVFRAVISPLMIVTAGLIWSYAQPAKNSRVNTSETLTRGSKLATMVCGQCHFGADGLLSGRVLDEVPKMLGRITAPNITTDSIHGIAGLSRDQLKLILRTGIKPDGSMAYIAMPRFPLMSDNDVDAIVDFLKSNESIANASSEESKPLRASMVGRLAAKVFAVDYPKSTKVAHPDTTDLLQTGQYLVDGVFHCFACHSSSLTKIDFLVPSNGDGYLHGGSKHKSRAGDKLISANLTFDMESGLGKYTLEDFKSLMLFGKKREGGYVKPPMVPYALLSDREIRSIYEYLKSRPVVLNRKTLPRKR